MNMKHPLDPPLSYAFCSTNPPPPPPPLHPTLLLSNAVRQVTSTYCIGNKQNIIYAQALCTGLISGITKKSLQPINGRREKLQI